MQNFKHTLILDYQPERLETTSNCMLNKDKIKITPRYKKIILIYLAPRLEPLLSLF